MNASYSWEGPQKIWECVDFNPPRPKFLRASAGPLTDDGVPPLPPVASDDVSLKIYDGNNQLYADASHEMHEEYSVLLNNGAAEGTWR